MAVSKTRLDASRLCLRFAIGGMALVLGFEALRHSAFPSTLAGAGHWGLHLTQMLGGALIMLGLLMPVASIALTAVVAYPLVLGWLNGAPLLGNLHGLFLLLVVVAGALGGAGQWAVGRD